MHYTMQQLPNTSANTVDRTLASLDNTELPFRDSVIGGWLRKHLA